jgi:hypothetical protein
MTNEIKLDRQVLGKRMEFYLQNAIGFHEKKQFQEYQYYKGRFVECITWFKDLGFQDLYAMGIAQSEKFNLLDKIFETS